MKNILFIEEERQKIQNLLEKLGRARTLVAMILIAFEIGKIVAVMLVEKILEQRSQMRCQWPTCLKCGARIENKDWEDRQIKSILGMIRWKRKVGRCPNGCKIGQVVPLDKVLRLGLFGCNRSHSKMLLSKI